MIMLSKKKLYNSDAFKHHSARSYRFQLILKIALLYKTESIL